MPAAEYDSLNRAFGEASPILFLGAGFSWDAKDSNGVSIPLGRQLTEELWNIAFPGDPFEGATTLRDIFQVCIETHRSQTIKHLEMRLTVAQKTLPSYYATWFSPPWHRIYSLNIDTLPSAARQRFRLPRPTKVISARQRYPEELVDPDELEVVCLNGTLADLPDRVVFTGPQFAGRLNELDPWYQRLAAEFITHPIIFVGTELDEPSLWSHIELRKRSADTRELRPKSYLVTPAIPRARALALQSYNITHIAMTAKEFAERVLDGFQDTSALGFSRLKKKGRFGTKDRVIPLVKDLLSSADSSTDKKGTSDFLLGSQPSWDDITRGVAIQRTIDVELGTAADIAFTLSLRPLLCLVGTAGSGKSSSLMRLALSLHSQGYSVGWIDQTNDISSREIKHSLDARPINALLIDDIDEYASSAVDLADFAYDKGVHLVCGTIRATRVDSLRREKGHRIDIKEIQIGNLDPTDAERLISTLESHNRLGILTKASKQERLSAFLDKADRQLIVAMIEATSGAKFNDKVSGEYQQLTASKKSLYLAACIATFLGGRLTREQLIQIGGSSMESLTDYENLVARGLLTERQAGTIEARHRVIAERVLEAGRREGHLREALRALSFVAAQRLHPQMNQHDRALRFVRRLINHDFLARMIGPDGAREVYNTSEPLLREFAHFWLQRCNLEIEHGSISDAEHWAGTAHSLAADDRYVRTAVAHVRFRKAILDPDSTISIPSVTTASEELVALSLEDPSDGHPPHILGSQTIAWVRRAGALISPQSATDLLNSAILRVRSTLALRASSNLDSLLQDLTRESTRMKLGIHSV